jgi:nitroreductase
MELREAITSRKSTKKFDGKPVNWKKVIQALDVARFAPMAGNINVTHFILVEDKEKIGKIAASTQQSFVGDAGMLIAVVTNREKLKKMFDANNKGFAEQQSGAIIQNVLLALTEKKIDNCWVGFFDDDEIKEVLKIPEGETIEAIIAVGTASKMTRQPAKKPDLENMVYFEKFGTKRKEGDIVVRHDWA